MNENKEIKRGKTLMTPFILKTWSKEEIERNNLSEARMVFSDFYSSDNGRSRKLICSFNPSHPDYENYANSLVSSYNGTVAKGLNPDEYENVITSLKWALEEIKIISKQVPVNKGYNVATDKGKIAFGKHLEGMINIENALRNSAKSLATPLGDK